MPGNRFVGIGGWNFPRWRGKFYPKGLVQRLELHHASRVLTSIEINSTFYGAQKPASFQKWHDETPDSFVFAVKAPMFATHRKHLPEGASSIDRFLKGGVLRLGDKLGPLNWQLAPTKRFDATELAQFLALLPAESGGRPLRHALEARHESFDCTEAIAVAREHDVAIVEAADSKFPHIAARTASFSYLRLMGTRSKEPCGYPAAALTRWADRVRRLASRGDVFVYFISGAKELNPLAAQALIARLRPRRK
jgi:uncharacterized protein YecE (DUF72 family)